MTTDDGECPTPERRRDVGARLSRAREDAGLTPDDVAGRLNLRMSFVMAVEEGSGDEHMEWSYERNHIRAIASLLGVDVGDLGS